MSMYVCLSVCRPFSKTIHTAEQQQILLPMVVAWPLAGIDADFKLEMSDKLSFIDQHVDTTDIK